MANLIIRVKSFWHSQIDAKLKNYSDESEWKVSDNRFVASLDILGFKKLVENESHENILKKFEFITEKKNIVNNGKEDSIKPINIVAFSDSIVIFSKNDSFETFEIFLYAVAWIFSEMIKEQIPLKGGISHGLLTSDFRKEIYFGKPLIEAFQTEEIIHFMGLVSHSSISTYLDTLEIKLPEDIFITQKVYMKNTKGESFKTEQLVLNSYPFFIIDKNEKFPEIMQKMSDSIYKINSLEIYDEYKK